MACLCSWLRSCLSSEDMSGIWHVSGSRVLLRSPVGLCGAPSRLDCRRYVRWHGRNPGCLAVRRKIGGKTVLPRVMFGDICGLWRKLITVGVADQGVSATDQFGFRKRDCQHGNRGSPLSPKCLVGRERGVTLHQEHLSDPMNSRLQRATVGCVLGSREIR